MQNYSTVIDFRADGPPAVPVYQPKLYFPHPTISSSDVLIKYLKLYARPSMRRSNLRQFNFLIRFCKSTRFRTSTPLSGKWKKLEGSAG